MNDVYILPGVCNILQRSSPFTIRNLKDLIALCDADEKKLVMYPDLAALEKIKEPLQELEALIGLDSIKKSIIDQVLNYAQGLSINHERHVIITGPPGVGKTSLCGILAKIYAGIGQLSRGHVVSCKRHDLIGRYLGWTADKTAKKIEEAFGGVLLIDEAYSLGNPEGKDTFSRECIDTLNRYLSEHADKFICIIVGYKDSIYSSLFAYNSGLRSRFTYCIDIKGYTSEQLQTMFINLTKEMKWYLRPDVEVVIDKNHFPHFGRDIRTFFTECCKASSRRTFGLPQFFKKRINEVDFKKGMESFLHHSGEKERRESQRSRFDMYV